MRLLAGDSVHVAVVSHYFREYDLRRNRSGRHWRALSPVPCFLNTALPMNRRQTFQTIALGAVAAGAATQSATSQSPANTISRNKTLVTAKDGTNLLVMDWGTGLPVVLLAGWAFNWTIWGKHIAALTVRGLRCVALDRRSHGRSDAARRGYDLDTLAVTWRRSLKSTICATSSLLPTPWVLSWRFVT